ncbi:MAG: type II secretion system minor pseudopilin GspJ [Candidatus Thiodiazotropha endolucinida]|nr:type II secretion system minor pseudopilin GspJ [Candidatus Thiodiazotropha taylori]MCG8092381.1 type II secretion system minor pseudopilin GspJ [Candidatus Thiodiazotropha endolucinida]MCG8059172.1 type II secretion system minor pseudopilin GspJ [Candidatus Thiodiazotropha taylori]MCG8062797.1 type II secretion system minor pseudopilin GspJ [Candidatus Thiodiazotropha taylori]MCW4328874.1 type II secretion system minor pseudopilin GspJ [Candidatus Thiodiazotropha endolucinida]
MNHHPRSHGFTLLELLIAITIFAILATFGYSGLKVILDTEHQTSLYGQRIAKLQLGLNLMQRDIEQIVGRPVRDQYGDQQPALKSGGISGILLELTRGGFSNPMQLSRSNLQRVGYVLEDNTLFRLTWPTLDRPRESEPHRQKLIEEISSLELVFYDKALQEKREWPPRTIGEADEDPSLLPVSIELKLELEDWGSIRRLFRAKQQVPVENG